MGNHDQTSQSVDDVANLVKGISLEAPEEPSTHNGTNGSGPKVQNSSFIEVRSSGDLGKGVFAVQDIARGTRVISEAPLFVVQPASAPEVFEEHIEAFCTAVRALSVEGLKTLDELCCDEALPKSNQKKAQKIIHRWHEQHRDEKGYKLNTRKLKKADKRAFTRFSIFLNNRMGMGRDSMYGQGLFPLHSRMNHSCSPNVVSSYNPTIERLTVHTTRDIKAGDEVLGDYRNGTFLKKFNRQVAMKYWGFVCQCSACTNPEEEALRDHMVDLEMSLLHENHPDLPNTGLEGSEEVARSPQQALEVNEKIAALLRHPTIDLQSISLCRIYRRCSRLCLELDDFQKAKEYARKELELEEAVIGTETEHLREDLVGAKYWLEYLEEEY
ncbi:hypothetical protein INS49_008755 [Diaporthe citri]|uniref:uncharacterized protein n=1 Tax=Diaporthe citri TaxID=83186 RepID=UPI001C808A96|nr:uncharacterized protein INS49_008755 [Diaporthe citri]KAG6363654.1 hypothetical protein INS49_008755 [Diaporthe citri]